jgi:hypothetical protein
MPPPTLGESIETAVFATANPVRRRAVRMVAELVGVVVLLWLAAMAAGLIGLGQLPGVPQLGARHEATPNQKDVRVPTPPPHPSGTPAAKHDSFGAQRARSSKPSSSRVVRSPAPAVAVPRRRTAKSRPAPAPVVGRAPTTTTTPAATQLAVQPAQPTQRTKPTAPAQSQRPAAPPGQAHSQKPTR